MSLFDLKGIQSVLGQLEEERGISREKTIEAIEHALATAYRKEYGKRGQIVRAHFDINTGDTMFEQVKIVVDESTVRMEDEDSAEAHEPTTPHANTASEEEHALPRYNPEQHILLEDAQRIKKDAALGDELLFPLDAQDDFGRIAAQTARQMIIQKIREAEKEYLSDEFGKREGEIVTGHVQRIERGTIYVDLGRATGILPPEEQIPGERYRQGERVRAYLYRVEESPRGVYLKLSRSHPTFLFKLFESESPEVANGTVEIRAIAREAGSRSKVAVYSNDAHIDPVGALVGQRGVRVSTVTSELGGEKVDIIEWSDDPIEFIAGALSPAQVLEVTIEDEEDERARVVVSSDQQSLAIGRGGQNVRLAAKLTGWHIDIQSIGGPEENEEGENNDEENDGEEKESVEEKEDAPTSPEAETSDAKEETVDDSSEKSTNETVDETTGNDEE